MNKQNKIVLYSITIASILFMVFVFTLILMKEKPNPDECCMVIKQIDFFENYSLPNQSRSITYYPTAEREVCIPKEADTWGLVCK